MSDPFNYFADDQRRRQQQRDQSLRLDPRRINEANAFADQTDAIDQSLTPQRAQPKGFWGHVLNAAPTIAASLAENLTGDSVGDRFFSGLGRGFLDQQGRAEQQAAQQQASTVQGQKLKMDLYDRTLRQRQIDADRQPEWRQQGYPDFETWQADQRRGVGGGPNLNGLFATKTDEFGKVTGITRGGQQIDLGNIGAPPAPTFVPGVMGGTGAPVTAIRPRGPGPIQTQEIAPTPGMQRTPSAGQQDDLAAIDASASTLNDIETDLKGNEEAFGLGRQIAGNLPGVGGLARRVITREDAEKNPGFVRARATVAALNSTIRKLQSGAAVTPYEGAVLNSFLADEWKDDAASIRIKVQGLRRWLANRRTAATQQRTVGTPADGPPDDL